MRTLLFLVSAFLLVACGGKQKQEDIIVEKVIEAPATGAVTMPDDEQNGTVKWVNGLDYSYSIVRSVDSTLVKVTNHDEEYYDNKIDLLVQRPDGTTFFEKTFTKKNFEPVLPNDFMKNGVLLGMHLEKAEGNEMRFIVSVGSPDDNNEEFYLVVMTLDNLGHTSAKEYKVQDAEE